MADKILFAANPAITDISGAIQQISGKPPGKLKAHESRPVPVWTRSISCAFCLVEALKSRRGSYDFPP